MTEPEFLVVQTTVANHQDAEALANSLLQAKLAACVQIDSPMQSYYRWKGKLHSDTECRVSLKARGADYHAIEAHLLAKHPYEEPQILALPILHGSPGYLNWIQEQCTGNSLDES